ncbi:hyaluronate lyase N-terminal domain-containing protein [Priestia abyssalis]|uniref:hyaluronate lyase N-terminal domain-containing protein n=1 Tax=Priestia abyssalis TaxID=1221450 RepID=UPI001F1658A1|nr:phage tail protein [Priestia abyssalis]
MPRKALIQVRRGPEANINTLAVGELGFCTDTQKLYIGTTSGNVLLVAAQTVGDMLKSIYDTSNNGKVDVAESADSVAWVGVTGKPSTFPPSTHTHDRLAVTDTRSANTAPADYDKELKVEFKYRSTISAPGTATYGGLITLAPWSDGSGGHATQIFASSDGLFIRRASLDATSWGTWEAILTDKKAITWNDLKGV